MQLHLQAVRIYQVDAKARSGDMTSKHNVTLAHQRSEKREKKNTEMARCKKQQQCKCEPYVRTDSKVACIITWNIQLRNA